MKIGSYTLYPIEAGTFGLDGGAMFGIVPKPLWSKSNPPDEQNRIELAMRCLLLKSDDRIVLIDNGGGNKYTGKQKNIYKFEDSLRSLFQSLDSAGVDRMDVTDMILTHLHFDHAGGTTMYENGRLVPTFPNARHYVQKAHWEHAHNPTDRDRGSFLKQDFELLREINGFELVDGAGEILPGIEVVVTNGHTAAQQLPKISDGKTTLFYCCDLVPTTSHIPYPYIMGFDIRPLETLKDKKLYLTKAFEEEWVLFFEHDPEIKAGKLRKTEKGFALGESFSF